MLKHLFFAVFLVVPLVWETHSQGLFPLQTSIEANHIVWSNSTQFRGNPCAILQLGGVAPTFRYDLVRDNETWTDIADRNNISTYKLLFFNNFVPDEVFQATGFAVNPIPGTYVVVGQPPAVAPDCSCPPSFPVYSDDDALCLDSTSTSSRSRILSTAYLPQYTPSHVTSTTTYWELNRTALVSEIIIILSS